MSLSFPKSISASNKHPTHTYLGNVADKSIYRARAFFCWLNGNERKAFVHTSIHIFIHTHTISKGKLKESHWLTTQMCYFSTSTLNLKAEASIQKSIYLQVKDNCFGFWKGPPQMMKRLRVSYFLEACSQLTSKTEQCLLQYAKSCAEQEHPGEGSEILEKGVSRMSKQANQRIYDKWDFIARQILIQTEAEGGKESREKRKKENILTKRYKF